MRKKQEKQFIPSKYQEAIFDFIENKNGNLIIEAVAGAGKTSTLIGLIERIGGDKNILYAAFNTDVVTSLRKRLKGHSNVYISTIHSLGYHILHDSGFDYGKPVFKYSEYIRSNIRDLSSINPYSLGKLRRVYLDNIEELVNLLRFNLMASPDEAWKLSTKYDMNILADECDVAAKVLEWGLQNTDFIDYTDMIWYPNVLPMNFEKYKYDYILVDECQDLSTAQRELILKCGKEDSRFVFVGDRSQAIYGFASADLESFDKIKSLPNMTSLPLSVTYRCAETITSHAKLKVPQIENSGDGRKGEVKYSCSLDEVQDGDMVLCRNNAPLFKVYMDFLSQGRNCHISGKDTLDSLTGLLNANKGQELNVNLDKAGFFVEQYDLLFKLRDQLMSVNGLSKKNAMENPVFEARLDKLRALAILSQDVKTTDELLDKIKKITKESSSDGITLSTIHKAKGLENDRVFIACRSLLPAKSAKLQWQKEQEDNLEYVAITRAKNFLGYLKEDGFKEYIDQGESLNLIEEKVNQVLSGTLPKKQLFFPKKGNSQVKRGTFGSLTSARKPVIASFNALSLKARKQRK